MKRTRIKHDIWLEKDIEIDHWAGEAGWQPQSIVPVKAPSLDYDWSKMTDINSEIDWHNNDVDHMKYYGKYGADIPGDPTALDTHLRFVKWNSTSSLSWRFAMPCGYIVEDLKRRYGTIVGNPYPPARVESWFEADFLPNQVRVGRDPFESSFSIWFLVADIVMLPKLAASLLTRQIIRRHEFGNKTPKQLADDSLAIKFGILPFMRDLEEFVGVLKRFRNGILEFEKRTKDVYHWRAAPLNLMESLPDLEDIPMFRYAYFGQPAVAVKLSRTPKRSIFYRSMSYRLKCPDLRSWLARLKQFIDLFGVFDPAALWDVIPFSFIIDWVIPIGRWLSNNKPRLFPAQFEVLDYCESIVARTHLSYRAQYFEDEINPVTLDVETGYPLDTVFARELHTTYVRRRFRPDPDKLVDAAISPILNIRHAIIAASLSAQRVPRSGAIGDAFEGVDFSPLDKQLPETPEAQREAAVNKAWADRMRQRKLELKISNPSLFKFEKHKRVGPPLNPRLPRRSERLKMPLYWMKNIRLNSNVQPGHVYPIATRDPVEIADYKTW